MDSAALVQKQVALLVEGGVIEPGEQASRAAKILGEYWETHGAVVWCVEDVRSVVHNEHFKWFIGEFREPENESTRRSLTEEDMARILAAFIGSHNQREGLTWEYLCKTARVYIWTQAYNRGVTTTTGGFGSTL